MLESSSKFYWKKQLIMLLVFVVVAGGFPAAFATQIASAAGSDSAINTSPGDTVYYVGGEVAEVVIDGGLSLDSVTLDVYEDELTGATIVINDFQNGDTLHFTDTDEIKGQYNSSNGVLTLTGEEADISQYEAALRSVAFSTTSQEAGERNITFTLGSALAFSGTGHFYEYINKGGANITWNTAKEEAETKSYFGRQGYLVTITSEAENDFVKDKTQGIGWLGALDINRADGSAKTEVGDWRWVTGPEGLEDGGNGLKFYEGYTGTYTPDPNPGPVNEAYNNWDNGEPNNYDRTEYVVHIFGPGNQHGRWNDYAPTNNTVFGYIIEYGGMPGDAEFALSATKTISLVEATAPKLETATLEEAGDGVSELKLTFDQEIELTDLTGLTVKIGDQELALDEFELGSDGKTLTLKLTEEITSDDILTVSYTESEGNLKATKQNGGLPVADFTHGVENNLTPPVDKSALQEKVDEAAALEEEDYTPESWQVVEEALDKAQSVLEDEDATQEQVDEAREALEKALKNLVPVTPVDKSALQRRTNEINKEIADGDLRQRVYTSASWQALQEALENAKAVLDNEDATQEEVDAALATLNDARDDLKRRSSGGGNIGYPLPTPNPTPGTNADIDVKTNDETDSFATGTEKKLGEQTETEIHIDRDKVKEILSKDNGQKLSVHVPNEGRVTATGLTAADLKQLAETGSNLDISNLLAIYPVPSGQLDLGEIANHWDDAALEDIAVNINIELAPNGVIEAASNQAAANGYELLVDPVALDLTFEHDGQTIRSGLLNGYAPRYIALPEDIDPNRITTGVVVNPDGTVFHVPTVVTRIDNRYFALINDLRSSGTYSVIWNPKDFDDVRDHWAQSTVNNIAARLDLAGTGNNTWSPARDIDRAEFATIVAYGMGLMRQEMVSNIFNDVNSSAWYYSSVSIANEFGIVEGYEDGSFRGNQWITREEGFAMIARAYRLAHPQAMVSQNQIDQVFKAYTDADQISKWAQESVALLLSANIVEGKDGDLLKPQEYVTRVEIVDLLEKLLKVTQLID